MAWMKAYPKDADPFYLFILVNYVLSRSLQNSEMDCRLCQMLAFKAFVKAAADTVDQGGKLVGVTHPEEKKCQLNITG